MSMMALGPFRFSLQSQSNGVQIQPFEELNRRASYEWAEQALIGKDPAVQYTGNNAEQITLRGRIFPYYKGGLGQLDQMRTTASSGRALAMVDGLGSVLGNWGITSIEETQRYFFEDGTARAIDFTLQLKKIDHGDVPAGKPENITLRSVGPLA